MTSDQNRPQVRPGTPYPLGVTLQDGGANVAVFSQHARSVSLCLFESEGHGIRQEHVLPERSGYVWHGWFDGISDGDRYALRVNGEYNPDAGLRFNRDKLLVDPYARAIDGPVVWDPSIFSYDIEDPDDERTASTLPNDASIPKSIVVGGDFDWRGDEPLRTPLLESVIYETHVKGLTELHPDVPDTLRGTYLGACHPAIIEHLKALGVTAVEFLPIHEHVDDHFVISRGLFNYWGYSTLGFFAPHHGYATSAQGQQVSEFKEMVRTFHENGIEVLLDVVYNHTCEGNHLGPTLSWRGIDNLSYYHLLPDNPEYYLDFTGTGNSVRAPHPQTLTMILDSLRYWVAEMHVDGFRFDLAVTIGRDEYDFRQWAGVLDAIHQDPVLAGVKLIAEPWDIGEGGYQLGNFPVRWSEWNDRYRDDVRGFWLADSRSIADMGYRLTGSSDIYENTGRGPVASVNFIAAHDGFTLNDLVSYNEKHNDANGEGGQDGHSHNLSYNHGFEGDTDEPEVLALRQRQRRNLLTTLMLSQGVPMILGGDEMGRTQQGNNNAYCQDNEISWFDWSLGPDDQDLLAFTQRLIGIRAKSPLLRRRRFFRGRPATPDSFDDITWLRPDGERMTEANWLEGASTISMRLAGDAIEESTAQGETMTEPSLLVVIHAGPEDVEVTLPSINRDPTVTHWNVLLDTGTATGEAHASHEERSTIVVPGRSVLLMQGEI